MMRNLFVILSPKALRIGALGLVLKALTQVADLIPVDVDL